MGKKKDTGRTRINCRIPTELKSWADKYAEATNTTFTAVVVALLTDLKKTTEEADVQQF